MSEAKKVAIGVVSGVLGIAVLFALILMIVGKVDEPAPRLQPIVATTHAGSAETGSSPSPTSSSSGTATLDRTNSRQLC